MEISRLPFLSQDDYSLPLPTVYQELLAPENVAVDHSDDLNSISLSISNPNKRRRSESDGGGGEGSEEPQSAAALKEIASLLSLDKEPGPCLALADWSEFFISPQQQQQSMDSFPEFYEQYFSNNSNHSSPEPDVVTTPPGAKRPRLFSSPTSTSAAVIGRSSSSPPAQHLIPQPPQKTHQRRLWVKDRSKDWWERCNRPDFPDHEFKLAFRMSKSTFNFLCSELDAVVTKKDTMLRAAIPTKQRVAVCIWRLATGEPLRLVSKRFGLGISTCHKLVLEVCAAIKSLLMPRYLNWPDSTRIPQIKAEFESVSGIPNVAGSMYTTHIPIIAPKISVASYFNKRHTERNQKTSYSITIQGVVDDKGVFTDVCIGWPGSMSDEKVLEKSALYERGKEGLVKDLWVVGGKGYPLMEWVLVPYTHGNLTWTQHAFNEKVGVVQEVGKAAFGRLKGRWACLQKRTEVKLQDLPAVLGACCVLHNICEMRGETMEPEWAFEIFDDEMVAEEGSSSVGGGRAGVKRDQIAHHLLHHGLGGTGFL